MKRLSQITAGMNMVTFGGLTKHFLMMLVEYFSIIYTLPKNYFGSNDEESVGENKDYKNNSCLVTLDLVLNSGSDILGPT